jgi:hypothetical protein
MGSLLSIIFFTINYGYTEITTRKSTLYTYIYLHFNYFCLHCHACEQHCGSFLFIFKLHSDAYTLITPSLETN